MHVSKTWIRLGCVGGSLVALGAAAWSQQERLMTLWVRPAAVELPTAPAPPSGAAEETGADRYQPIHRRFGPPAGRPAAPERPPFSIAGGFRRAGEDVAVMMRNSIGKIRIYRPGQKIDVDGAEILSIDVDGEAIKAHWSNRDWVLRWDRSAKAPAKPEAPVVPERPAPQGSADTYEMTQDQLNDYSAHFMDKYWSQGRYNVLPNGGLLITHFEPAAEARKYGLRENDVILVVNGTKMEGLARITQVFNDLNSKPVDEYVLDIVRDKQAFQIRIKVKR